MLTTLILLALTVLIGIFYLAGRYHEYYWTKRGVKFHNEHRLVGPIWDFMTGRRPLFQVFQHLYRKYPNEPAVGVGGIFVPTLYVKDPVNVHHVLQQDFQSFYHRGVEVNDGDNLANNILFMNGKPWKLMRQSMTPLFTPAKLKNMYYIMDKASQDFVEFLKSNPSKINGNAYDTITMFCNAAISGAVFGIHTKSTFESPFLKVVREAFVSNVRTDLRFFVNNTFPSIFKLLKMKLFKEFEPFFIGSIKQVFKIRKEENVKKHDFADLCLAIQEKGTMRDPDSGIEMEPSDTLLAAQGFFFYIAGVEPCATSIFATLIELGRHPEIQKKVHEEIDATYEKHGENLTYDIVSSMEYLDKVLSEALRMYPPIPFLTRRCTKDTVLPVGNIPVSAGTKVFTPIYEYHHDEKYYPNPELFDPERFSGEINDMVHMPFGKGARVCIGLRYGRLQVKAGLVHLLRNFSVKTTGDTEFLKHPFQVRFKNVDIQFIPRYV